MVHLSKHTYRHTANWYEIIDGLFFMQYKLNYLKTLCCRRYFYCSYYWDIWSSFYTICLYSFRFQLFSCRLRNSNTTTLLDSSNTSSDTIKRYAFLQINFSPRYWMWKYIYIVKWNKNAFCCTIYIKRHYV